MKLCSFEVSSALGPLERMGMVTDAGLIVDLNNACAVAIEAADETSRSRVLADALVPADLRAFIENGPRGREALAHALQYLGSRIDQPGLCGPRGERLVWRGEEVRLLAPLPRPRTLRDCLVFEEHLRNARLGGTIPPVWYEMPIYYKGNLNTVAGPASEVPWPPYTEVLDYELEFAAVIGRRGVNLTPEQGWAHIFGYTIFNDVSARDIQRREMAGGLGPAKGKDLDGGNIFGPWLVTADEWNPSAGHLMTARVNGETWSRGTSAAMYHDFGKIVSHISWGMTVYPGDVIGSGTVGTGCGLELQRYPRPGDLIELEIEGLGVLRNRFGARR